MLPLGVEPNWPFQRTAVWVSLNDFDMQTAGATLCAHLHTEQQRLLNGPLCSEGLVERASVAMGWKAING